MSPKLRWVTPATQSFSLNIYMLYGPFLRSFLNLLQYCLYFYVLVFGHEAQGILAPQTDVKPPALEGQVLATGPTREAPLPSTQTFYFSYHQAPEFWISEVSVASEQCEGFFGAKSEASRLNIFLIDYFLKFLIIYWHDSKIKIVLKCMHWEGLSHLCCARL